MKDRVLIILLVLVMATLPMAANAGWGEVQQVTRHTLPAPSQVDQTPAPDEDFKSSPVMFIENVGQWDDGARFQVWGGPAGTMWLAEDAIWITVLEAGETSGQVDQGFDRGVPFEERDDTAPRRGVNIKLSFVGANPAPRIETFDRLDTAVSYFYGNDPDQWRPNLPVWGGVRYVDLYPGVNLEIIGEGGQMTQRLAAQPDADLSAVQLRVEGANAAVLEGGALRLSTAVGEINWPLLQVEEPTGEPTVQVGGGGLIDVYAPYMVQSREPRSTLATPNFPTDNPTDLIYGTFLGGNEVDVSYAIAIDGAGSAYVTGYTRSINFPTTPGAFDPSLDGLTDAFVVKLNHSGGELTYATFLGGSNYDDGYGITVDSAGNAYVTGTTQSGDFPSTPGAFDSSFNGFTDVFVVKLNPVGSSLSFATFLGGDSRDTGYAMVLDEVGNTTVTGETGSDDFPTTPGAVNTSHNGSIDVFVVKLNSAGSGLIYATFLGGSNGDYGYGIGADVAGSVYVTGWTWSSDFPSTPGAYDPSFNGGSHDAFVVKLNPSGSELVYATFLGGGDRDYGRAVAVDLAGSAYATGRTWSNDFPTTPGVFDPSLGSFSAAFIAKLNPLGSGLDYATFLGGSNYDDGYAIAADAAGRAYVVGFTYSNDFPTTPGAFDTSLDGDGDAFMASLDPFGSRLSYSTFVGGNSNYDRAYTIAVDETNRAYIAGYTQSPNFPTTPGALDPSFNGTADVFVIKLETHSGWLELPFYYNNFAASASGWTGLSGQGRVNSWLDHQYPTYDSDPNRQHPSMVKYTGALYSSTIQGISWYDGHDGIDFSARIGSRDVRAAAAGTVETVYDTCNQTCYGGSCCEYLGNRVEIDHGNGYKTIYGHLEYGSIPATVSNGTAVTQGSFLGRMGNTGNSSDPHLHFGVKTHVDNRWVAVDPYGWIGTNDIPNDPWAEYVSGAASNYLWSESLDTSDTSAANQGITIGDAAGFAMVNIGPAQTGGMISATLSNTPVPPPSTSPWRNLGRFFSLLLEYVPLDAANSALALSSPITYSAPITITMPFSPTDLLHFDAPAIAVHHWNESGQLWEPLATTVDLQSGNAVAVTDQTGKFDLQAPLLCPAEVLEPDDTYDAAQSIWQNDPPIERALDVANDTDWAMFQATAGVTYTLRTQNLAPNVATVLSVYEDAELSPEFIAGSNDPTKGPASELVWVAPHDGTFYFAVTPGPGSTIGCGATYELMVETIPGDVTGDCLVGVLDIQRVSEGWPTIEYQYGYVSVLDQDDDGDVDIGDIQWVAARWGQTCQ